MGDPTLEIPSPQKAPEERLDSWKEIAAYLNRDVTTVQRWEKRERMPVHRHLHDKRGSVYALPAELDEWMNGRRAGNQDESGSAVVAEDQETEGPSNQGIKKTPTRWFVLLPVLVVLQATGLGIWLQSKEFFWRNPVASASFRTLTDFERVQGAAAVSRDGQFVAFLSDRDGQMDVWVTQVGSGQFHNLTHGNAHELQNPSVRTLGFSPDSALVTFWARQPSGNIGIWSVPTMGGDIKPYLEGEAELDWSRDGSQLVYHPPSPGDPLFISDGNRLSDKRALYKGEAVVHCHFPIWSQDGKYVYFVMGVPSDKWDIWRIPATGGSPERITSQASKILYPVLLNRHTLLYLANDSDGLGPWLYSLDVTRRIPHRLTYGIERYTSLAATADGRRLVATLAIPRTSLWRLTVSDSSKGTPEPLPISIPTSNGFFPRLGPGYLLYVSSDGTNESLWKLVGEKGTELWKGEQAHFLGGPAISVDGKQIAFSAQQNRRSILYVMNADGTGLRVVTDALALRGAPAWTPDGRSISIAADDHGTPHLYRVSSDGKSTNVLVREYSRDAAWSSDGSFVIFSGPDIGTRFAVKAAAADGTTHSLPPLVISRGSRHIAVLSGGRKFAYLAGEIQHKNLWLLDPETGAQHQLTNLGPDFNASDFDISGDGHEVVFGRTKESSQVVLLDLPKN